MTKEHKDPHYVVKVEKAIAKKYGEETIQNPKKDWDEEKEKEYQAQIEEFYKKRDKIRDKSEKVEVDGVLIPKKLLNKRKERTCPVCKTYSFKMQDDVYMSKYECCFDCYIQHVQRNPDRWKSGWRP
tara:strand:- start:238 stop:618 length:381 start_codon:yes stop_codon:yes gene_type:complete